MARSGPLLTEAQWRWSPRGTPAPSTTTILFVPLPRLVFPTPAPFFAS